MRSRDVSESHFAPPLRRNTIKGPISKQSSFGSLREVVSTSYYRNSWRAVFGSIAVYRIALRESTDSDALRRETEVVAR